MARWIHRLSPGGQRTVKAGPATRIAGATGRSAGGKSPRRPAASWRVAAPRARASATSRASRLTGSPFGLQVVVVEALADGEEWLAAGHGRSDAVLGGSDLLSGGDDLVGAAGGDDHDAVGVGHDPVDGL